MRRGRKPPADAPFRFYNRTDEECYEGGFKMGNTWPLHWNHVPGGPYVPTPYPDDHPDWVAYCDLLARHHAEWMRGWWDGIREAAKISPGHRRFLNRIVLERLVA